MSVSVHVKLYSGCTLLEVCHTWKGVSDPGEENRWRHLAAEILKSYLLPGGCVSALLDTPQPYSVHQDLKCIYNEYRVKRRTFGWMANIQGGTEAARTIADSEEFWRGLLWVFAAPDGGIAFGEAVACYLKNQEAGYRFGGCSTRISAIWCDPDGHEVSYWNPCWPVDEVREHIERTALELQL